MAETTKIEWADATVSLWWGCTKVSEACRSCYAETLSHRWGRAEWGPGKSRLRIASAEATARKLERKAVREGRQLRVFAESMGDWLDHEVPAEWLADLLGLVAETPALTWMLLTKRPHLWRDRLWAVADGCTGPGAAFARLWVMGTPPANVWAGTTVEDQERADERIPALIDIPARVRFLSCEPLLGPVDLGLADGIRAERFQSPRASALHWIIAGGESGHGARPMHPAWVRSLRDQAVEAGVAFHMKQWGEWLPFCHATPEQINAHDCQAARFGWKLPVYRVGKTAAGRLLDGRTWDELPVVSRG